MEGPVLGVVDDVANGGNCEPVSSKDGSGGGSSLAKKLSHPLEEIRIRSFKTVLQKLDLGFVSVTDLGLQLEFVKACLKVRLFGVCF